LNQLGPFSDNSEINEIDEQITEIQLDLQSNSSTILLKPQLMRQKIDSFLKSIAQSEQRLYFFRKSNIIDKESFIKIGELEKKIAILKNQIELNQKMLKKQS
jgi:hypothetical protein